MKHTKTIIALALFSVLSVPVAFSKEYSSVNSDIKVAVGEKAEDLSSVNGDVLVGRNAQVGEISTVNGDISIKEESKLDRIDSVNGDIKLAKGSIISHGIETVNGDVQLDTGEIKGDISSVNGDLHFTGAKVGGDITVVNSDIELKDGTVIEGGITVKKGKSKSWFFGMFSNSKQNKPKIVFGKNVVVKGPVIFEKEVKLTMADNADVPNISYSYKK